MCRRNECRNDLYVTEGVIKTGQIVHKQKKGVPGQKRKFGGND